MSEKVEKQQRLKDRLKKLQDQLQKALNPVVVCCQKKFGLEGGIRGKWILLGQEELRMKFELVEPMPDTWAQQVYQDVFRCTVGQKSVTKFVKSLDIRTPSTRPPSSSPSSPGFEEVVEAF